MLKLKSVRSYGRPLAALAGLCALNAAAWFAGQAVDGRSAEGEVILGETIDDFEPRSLMLASEREARSRVLLYRLAPPLLPSPTDGYPAVVVLHGAGECGDDNWRHLQGLPVALKDMLRASNTACYVIAPQCPVDCSWIGGPFACDALSTVVTVVDDVVRTERIDPSRIYLVGYSLGGMGVCELGSRYPGRFAAIVAIAGACSTNTTALASHAVRVIHGSNDNAVSVQTSRDLVLALQKEGGDPVYDELHGAGHDVWMDGFVRHPSAIRWVLEQRLRPSR